MPVTLIGESVFARCLSSIKAERERASTILHGPEETKYEGDKKEFVEAIRQALYASKIVSYAQGFMLLRQAAKEFGWNLNYGGIALMWRCGCIIRSRFLGNIKAAFDNNPALDNLLLDDFFRDAIHANQVHFYQVCSVWLYLCFRKVGEGLWQKLWSLVSQHLASLQLWHSMMDTGWKINQIIIDLFTIIYLQE